jgi:nicotinic acid mononucleotide adenylyltransferase
MEVEDPLHQAHRRLCRSLHNQLGRDRKTNRNHRQQQQLHRRKRLGSLPLIRHVQ